MHRKAFTVLIRSIRAISRSSKVATEHFILRTNQEETDNFMQIAVQIRKKKI
jgi:hypothetical protein